ncbi:MAG: cytochrome c oxidase assembly protein [Vulcanimicrobiaceae bacterium]
MQERARARGAAAWVAVRAAAAQALECYPPALHDDDGRGRVNGFRDRRHPWGFCLINASLSAHMLQHVVLTLIGPPLILLGAPLLYRCATRPSVFPNDVNRCRRAGTSRVPYCGSDDHRARDYGRLFRRARRDAARW